MKDLKRNGTRRRYLAGLGAALLLILGLGAVFSASAIPQIPYNGGPWMNSTDSASCSFGRVCAEWPSSAADYIYTCCIDESDVGTTNYTGCQIFLGVRPAGGVEP